MCSDLELGRGLRAGVAGVRRPARLDQEDVRLLCATGQCSTPRGTTKSSPSPSSTSPSRSLIVSRPLRTRKKSSVSGCECQTNSPLIFPTWILLSL